MSEQPLDDHETPAADRPAGAAAGEALAPAPQPFPGEEDSQTAWRPRILWADDDPSVRDYVRRLLSDGYEVEAVADGEAALAAARRHLPDLVLADVKMPRLDGFGLLRGLRADLRTRAVPVILLSGLDDEASRVEGLEAGANDYLVKPFSARELLARVGNHVEMARVRREAEAALRQSEERLRLVADNIPALISYVDRDVRYRFTNAAYGDWFGIDPAGLAGRPVKELLCEESYRQRLPYIEAALRGETVRFEAPTRHRALGWRDTELTYVPDLGPDGIRGFYVMAHDVTERKRVEEALRESEARFRQLADSVPVLIWMSGPGKEGQYFNKVWLDFTGRALEDELGEGWLASVHPDDLNTNLAVCVEAFRERRPFQTQFRLRRADGEYRWVLDTGVPRFAPDGTFAGYIGSCLDITERKQAEEALREADRRKDEFLAVLAHELRNPLAPLRNGMQLLRLAGDDRAVMERARDIMERQLAQMVRLIDDLLDVSRISRGKIELRKEWIELSAVIQSALETSRPLIEASGHELTVSLPPEPVLLEADPTRLAQVFSNLLNNSARYTERPGRIWLAAERREGEVVVTVKDTGIGIPAGMLPQVFEMFTQVDRSLEKTRGGLGIGLTLVKRLVEMHGGSVTARSEGLGKGSEFAVRLPAVVVSPGREPGPAGGCAEKAPHPGCRVLVADDNEDAAASLAIMLRLLGYEIRTAQDGAEALEAAGDFRPHVMLLDIGMPRLNGYDLARRVREQPWGRDAVLIAMTGWGQDEDRRRSREAGFDRHLVKPVDPAALESLLSELRPPK